MSQLRLSHFLLCPGLLHLFVLLLPFCLSLPLFSRTCQLLGNGKSIVGAIPCGRPDLLVVARSCSDQYAKKFRKRSFPVGVIIDSGWNCTPSTGYVRCRRPMTSPSAVSAVISSSFGRVERSTMRL